MIAACGPACLGLAWQPARWQARGPAGRQHPSRRRRCAAPPSCRPSARSRVPDRLLDAIAMVESGRRDPISGAVYPWPWTINAEGVGHFYETKAEAIAAVQAFQAQRRPLDGCRLHAGEPAVPSRRRSPRWTRRSTRWPTPPTARASCSSCTTRPMPGPWPPPPTTRSRRIIGAEYARKVLAAWGVPQLPVGSQIVTNAATPRRRPPPSARRPRRAASRCCCRPATRRSA